MTSSCCEAQHWICTTAGSDLYTAFHLESGAPVLLKWPDPANTGSAQQARFRRECALLQSIAASGVAKPIALIDEGERLAIVLENFTGESLQAILDREVRIDLPACLNIASHLAGVLAAVHAAGVIHQDIRPVNILVARESSQVLLVDFSTASTQEREVPPSAGYAAGPGDWAYRSPEQTGRMNRRVDYRTDFYALGITLYRMLTGRLPFQADDPPEWVHCHVARMPPAASDVAPDIPQPVSDIVLRLLAKLPEDRYQSAQGLRFDLEQCLAQWQSRGRIEPFPLGAEDVSDRFQIPHKLYGREQETAKLLAAFDGMVAKGPPALVMVSGYSGIGKSSLVNALHKPIVEKRGYFISGKFDQYMRDVPYAIMAQAFRELVQQLLAESEARIALWRERIQEALGPNGQLIIDILPQVELIIGKQPPVPALPPTAAQNRFRVVFQRFITVFTRPEHPLVLFLDDLQWIDAASLMLIQHLLTDGDMRYLMLIGAYRDNEVGPAHPLSADLEAIRQDGAVTDIRLAPLSAASLNQLVADTLRAEPATVEPLTQLIFEKTAGNPFFFMQFFGALQQEGLLRHGTQRHAWQWDLRQIQTRDFADNIVDLMVGKLRRLPVEVQELLRLAACLGNRFELQRLVLVSRCDDVEVAQRLSIAEREGLIKRTDGSCKFLHDRIQQAAYSLIPEDGRAAMHLQIGRLLSAHLAPEEAGESLFEIVSQLNRGAGLITSPEERERLAEFNLVAGKRAKTSTAYAAALTYLAAGRALLTEESWAQRYPLIFGLEFLRAECEFRSSDLAAAEQRLTLLAARAATLVDSAAVACLRVELYVTLDHVSRSVELGLDYLRRIGVHWSPHPTKEEARAEYEEIWRRIGRRSVEELVDLPAMNDPEWRGTLDVLAQVVVVATSTDVNLLSLVVCRMANISLEHGNSDASCYAYVWLGIILGPHFDDYPAGFRFGKLGIDLVGRPGLDRFKARVYMCFGSIVIPWTKHIRTGRPLVRRAYDIANKLGDLSFAAHSRNLLITNLLASGEPLAETQQEAETGLAFARKIRFGLVIDVITAQLRLILALRGLTPAFNSFNDAEFDEARFEQHFEAGPCLALPPCWYWIRKLQARFHAGDYACAIDAELRAQRLLWTSPYYFEVAEYHFYAALARAAYCDAAAADERPLHLEALAAHHRQLAIWAQHCPENFENRTALVGAEIARLEGRHLEAERLYEEAIRSAHQNGFVQNKAVAHERAARFYQARGLDRIAQTDLREACACYARWGADGKVRQLEALHPQLRAQPSRGTTASLVDGAQLDLLSLGKASQAISGRLLLDELADTLLRIVLENAGAQAGCLLLARGEGLVLAAEASVDSQAVQVRLHRDRPPAESALPASILNYVRRSGEPVLLEDVAASNPFSGDPYFARHPPKSIACLAIRRQSALIGMLYLENRLVTHAFTPQRLTVLELLASQAAISLENAQLYSDLKQENLERRRAEETSHEKESRIRRLVDSNIIGIFFWNIGGTTTEANDALLQIIGYTREDVLSGRVSWRGFTPAEHRSADAQAVEELRQCGTCTPYEKEITHKDGRRIPVLVGGALFEGSQENGIAFVLDLTERKQAEAEREARQAADAANRAKSQFLANMSHELRTPLNGILGYAQILLRDRTLGERQSEGLNVIRQSGDHLLTLINDILDFAKIEAGRFELNPTDLPLAGFLRGIADVIGVRARQKRLDFISDLAPDLPLGIRADEARLRQVLLNLLSNAVKFTDRGEVTLRVRFRPPGRLRFEVQDTGIGIREDQLDTVFQPFEQVGDAQRRLGGTGLGLAISRQLLRLMGGDIQIESRIGQGSRFWFELDVPVIGHEQPAVAPAAIMTGYEGPRRKILVVDDVADNRAVVVDLLGPLGFETIEATSGREGVDQAQTLRPDLIVMDLAMPGMGGLEATRHLRQLPAFETLPIIAVSAAASDRDAQASIAAGMNAFHPKPLELSRFLAEIGTLLQLRWICAPPPDASTPNAEPAGTLVAPPASEMATLHRLARLGNMRDIRRQATRLAELDERYRPFADRLCRLAQGYQSQAILSLVEQVMEGDSSGSETSQI